MEYLVKLTIEELNLIGLALGKLPYESVAALIENLRGQAAKQAEIAAPPGNGESLPRMRGAEGFCS